jgi:O-acetyl-ADP-ribose deacetylase (regulator of RNase III)
VTADPVVVSQPLAGGRVFEVVIGNLLAEPVAAIVNAANGHLAHGGGVAAAIARAAGPALEEEGNRIVLQRGAIPTGDAVATTAGRLPFQAVIHAIGPIQGQGDEERLLVRALRSAFERASERGLASISFPAVSSGIFAVPLETCARAYLRAVVEHVAAWPQTSLRTIRLCLVPGPLVQLVRAEVERNAAARAAGGR